MIASQLIVDLLPALKPSDSFGQALLWMSEFKVSHLPLVSNNRFVGIVAEEDILDTSFSEVTFDSSPQQLDSIFIYEYQHIFEVMRKMSEFQLTIMPILNRNDEYIGSTTLSQLMTIASNTTSIKEPGGVIILRVNSKDYSLSQIA
ncbi:MAG: CBS domain-containing protein, partial [Flavobacteriales bacterium]